MARKRVIWIDLVRAIGMVLIIWGHSLPNFQSPIGDLIFAVNVPIFFVLSGYLYHPQKIRKQVYKLICNLLLPYYFTGVLLIVLSFLINHVGSNNYIKSYGSTISVIKCVFWGMGGNAPLIFSKDTIIMSAVGAIWFLIALFWASIIFNILMKSFKSRHQLFFVGLISVILVLISITVSNKGLFPFSINAGLFGVFFLWIGQVLKRVSIIKFKVSYQVFLFIIGILCWKTASYTHTFFGFSTIYSQNFLVALISSIGASIALILISIWLEKLLSMKIIHFISLYGKYSLAVLCIHLLDINLITISQQLTQNMKIVAVQIFITVMYHFAVTLVGIIICRNVYIFKNIYFNREYPFRFQKKLKFVNS